LDVLSGTSKRAHASDDKDRGEANQRNRDGAHAPRTRNENADRNRYEANKQIGSYGVLEQTYAITPTRRLLISAGLFNAQGAGMVVHFVLTTASILVYWID
jgi:hypothetical protein